MGEVSGTTDHTQLGANWDPEEAGLYGPKVRNAVMVAAELDDLTPGSTIVEIGSGTGYLTQALVEHPSGFEVVAIEPDAGALARLHEKFGHRPNLTILSGTFEDNSVPDHSAVRVLSTMAVHHALDPPLAMRQVARILRPAGRVVIADIVEHEFGTLVTGHEDPRPGTNMDDLRGWLEDAGLQMVDGPRVTDIVCTETTKSEAAVPIFLAVAEIRQRRVGLAAV